MFYASPIEELESIKRNIQRDIEWYKKPNRPGVNFTDAYRKERIAELTEQLAEYTHVITLLKDDRFNAIAENLIQFNCIEANLMALGSILRKISPKRPEIQQECVELTQDVLEKHFQLGKSNLAKTFEP